MKYTIKVTSEDLTTQNAQKNMSQGSHQKLNLTVCKRTVYERFDVIAQVFWETRHYSCYQERKSSAPDSAPTSTHFQSCSTHPQLPVHIQTIQFKFNFMKRRSIYDEPGSGYKMSNCGNFSWKPEQPGSRLCSCCSTRSLDLTPADSAARTAHSAAQ